ncbi:MAG: heme exporter protein CcmD [Acidiferrobacter sp.]
MTFSQFLAMGGFGFYVWSAYAFAAIVVLINIVQPLIHSRKVWDMLRRDLDRAREDE